MKKSTISAPVVDPIMTQATELNRLLTAEFEWDALSLHVGNEQKMMLEAVAEERLDKIDALERQIATSKATSLEGCLVQLSLLGSQMELYANGADEFLQRHAERTFYRLVYSIRDVLVKQAGLNEKKIASITDYYMPARMNPWHANTEQHWSEAAVAV